MLSACAYIVSVGVDESELFGSFRCRVTHLRRKRGVYGVI